ncbi:hypothetical protein [Marivirga harenae]|uniref:hypothetical protein n=1 Tax=Marivirga harenae TaxID=2010992 RepID=UPI0026DF7667|nr:hypothetical protein [Marivirga harenae]WKV12629.1 hypothetical protein Q3Y49_02115 [Marivirga harenae]
MANLSAQQTTDEQRGEVQNSGARFYNGNLGYVRQWKPSELRFSASMNVSLQEATDMQNLTVGPVFFRHQIIIREAIALKSFFRL